MGDVDGGGLQVALQVLELASHVGAQLGVEVGDRLVEEEHLGFAHDGAADGGALLLPAAELYRLAVE